ncbi:MAG TPA: SRPBCC family protein [Actinomycetota bacterium]|nr:SRPBCC family protein [Actinomycetota bacterium]
MRFEERALVRADPKRVWDVLTDWERQASWMPDVARIRLVGSERELGARLEVRTKVFGIPLATDRVRVTAWEPPRRLAIDHVGVVVGVGEWHLEATESGTRFVWYESFRMPPPILGGLALLLYSPFQRFMLRRSIRNLKRLVEASAA